MWWRRTNDALHFGKHEHTRHRTAAAAVRAGKCFAAADNITAMFAACVRVGRHRLVLGAWVTWPGAYVKAA
jgi:hypothetical protein